MTSVSRLNGRNWFALHTEFTVKIILYYISAWLLRRPIKQFLSSCNRHNKANWKMMFRTYMCYIYVFHSKFINFHTSSRFLDNLNRALSTMLLGLLVFYGANELIFRVCNVLFNSRTNLNDMTIAAQVASAPRMTALIVVLLAPFVEEVLFRGLVFGCLKEKSRIFAYILSCALFAFLHVWTAAVSNWDLGYLILMLQYLVPGLVFAWAYEHSGTLWTSILLHMLVNALSLFTIAS